MTHENALDSVVVALRAGDPAEAERLCLARLQSLAGDPATLVLLALSRWRQDRRDEAIDIYEGLAQSEPGNRDHWANFATAAQHAGDTQRTRGALEHLTRLEPGNADWHHQLGLLELEQGNLLEARDALLRAFAHAPESAPIRVHAAHACAACHDMRAGGLIEPWRSWLPLDDTLQFEVADVLAQMGEAGDAVELLEDLDARVPGQFEVQLLLASMYERVNRVRDAEALLDRLGEGRDDVGAARLRYLRAQLLLRRGDLAPARALLESPGVGSTGAPSVENHWFALAGVCDKMGDTGATMRALAAGHAAKLEALRRLGSHLLEPGVTPLPNQEVRVSQAEYATWPTLTAPERDQSPLFVVGFPRSGTTLLEQMLDAHPRLQSMDERPFFNVLAGQLENSGIRVPEDLARLDQGDCDELRKGYWVMACDKVPRRWNARLVDKNPLNMLWLPLIQRMFPHAQFIFALRHPCDVVLSCYMQNFRSPSLAVAAQSMDHLARAYVAAMEAWIHHVAVFKPDVFVSRYEDLVADAPAQTRRIAAFLGLEGAEAMLKFDERAREKGNIKTPSYTQVIEPLNRRGIGRWQRYREFFEPVLPILERMLRHWDYLPSADLAQEGD